MASGSKDAIKIIHFDMLIEFDRNISTESEEYDDLVTAMKAVLDTRDIGKCKKPSDFIERLEHQGECAPADYGRLRQILSMATKKQALFHIIDNAEARIAEARIDEATDLKIDSIKPDDVVQDTEDMITDDADVIGSDRTTYDTGDADVIDSDKTTEDTGDAGVIGSDLAQKKHIDYVVRYIGRHYMEMAHWLEISDSVLDYIKDDNPHDARERVRAIMRKWMEENGNCATVQKLCDVLTTIRRKDIADNLKQL